jgi:hypothetical protein
VYGQTSTAAPEPNNTYKQANLLMSYHSNNVYGTGPARIYCCVWRPFVLRLRMCKQWLTQKTFFSLFCSDFNWMKQTKTKGKKEKLETNSNKC